MGDDMKIDLSQITVGDYICLQRALSAGELEEALRVLERYAPGLYDMPLGDFIAALREAVEEISPKAA